jgi:hypothetical protein
MISITKDILVFGVSLPTGSTAKKDRGQSGRMFLMVEGSSGVQRYSLPIMFPRDGKTLDEFIEEINNQLKPK